MRVACFTAGPVHPLALAALKRSARHFEVVQTDGLHGYQEALAARWDGSSDLVVTEGDKELLEPGFTYMLACDQPWCVASYEVFPPPWTRTTGIGLGCARFIAGVQRLIPDPGFRGSDPDYTWCPECGGWGAPGCWRNMDARIAARLMAEGIMPHVHDGVAVHHHDYPADWAEKMGPPEAPREW